MPAIDIFEDDAFSLASLTATINDMPAQPSRLGDLGLFDEEGVTTTTVQVEKDGETLALIAAGERGVPGQNVAGDCRVLLPFNTIHLPARSVIKADEVTNLRAFGSETELESVQSLVAKRQNKHRKQLDATIEFHRVGALRGKVLDSDGRRVLLDVYNAFGIEQRTVVMDLAKDTLRAKCLEVFDAMDEVMGAEPYNGARVMCGRVYWGKLMANKAFSDAARDAALAAALRGDPREAVEFGGMVWERYRGKVGGVAFVGEDEAYAYPESSGGLFITRFAPADHVDAVGTIGLPYYTSQEILPHGKGVDLESQSNTLNLCTKPGAVIRLTP